MSAVDATYEFNGAATLGKLGQPSTTYIGQRVPLPGFQGRGYFTQARIMASGIGAPSGAVEWALYRENVGTGKPETLLGSFGTFEASGLPIGTPTDRWLILPRASAIEVLGGLVPIWLVGSFTTGGIANYVQLYGESPTSTSPYEGATWQHSAAPDGSVGTLTEAAQLDLGLYGEPSPRAGYAWRGGYFRIVPESAAEETITLQSTAEELGGPVETQLTYDPELEDHGLNVQRQRIQTPHGFRAQVRLRWQTRRVDQHCFVARVVNALMDGSSRVFLSLDGVTEREVVITGYPSYRPLSGKTIAGLQYELRVEAVELDAAIPAIGGGTW